MIIIENITYDVVRLRVTDTIKVGDFQGIAPQIDALIKERGTIRLLLDGRLFKGWENFKAFKEHLKFVKNHHLRVKRIAILAGRTWHYWLTGLGRLFVHPKIKVFNAAHSHEALTWVTEN